MAAGVRGKPMNRVSIAALAVLIAAPALAKPPSALLRCDGYGRRVGVGESLARLPLVIGTLGLFGAPEPDNPLAREGGEKGVQACTEALSDARVTGNAIRRAEVRLMRGIRNLEVGSPDAAFADGEAALATALPAEVKPWFDMTLRPSALLLQAHARVAQGRDADAETLALAAAAARPWGWWVPGEAARLLALTPTISPGEAELLERLYRLSASTLRAQARERAGDWAGAAADFGALVGAADKPDVVVQARLAADQALAGNTAGAEATLARVQQQVDELAATAGGTDRKAQDAASQVARADELTQLARAQLALVAGQPDDAKAILLGRSRWLAPAPIAAAVIANVQAKVVPGSLAFDPAKLRGDAATVARTALVGKEATGLKAVGWPRWEDPDVAAGYGKDLATRPAVVKVERVRDGGATEVSIFRNAAVDTQAEALLLLAARIATEQGATRFAVIARGLSFGAGRQGMTGNLGRLTIVTPRDKLWAGQEDRAIEVAAVEAALAPRFPAPANPRGAPQR
ncbi:hypothetical protein IP88_05085 [alpha proteobacterium AAP81b]|nr:hypothetical protein IP88_05085 [alpha proteobacterium AAP81b]